MVSALSHITFIVRDLDRMEEILVKVLNSRKIYDSGEDTFSLSKERFFDIGGVWVAIMEGDGLLPRSYNHVAFEFAAIDYEEKLAVLKSLGLEVKEGRPRVEGEGSSIYFYDHDNHLFELHAGSLEERLKRYASSSSE